MKNVNILSFLEEKTRALENCVALGTRTSLGWSELTYKGLNKLASKVGSYLISIGMEKNDKAAILSESMPEFGAVIFGTFMAGLTIVPLDVKLTIHEYTHILTDCLPRVLFTSETYLQTAEKIKEIIPSIEHIVIMDSKKTNGQYANLYSIEEDPKQKWRHQRLDKTAIICYTSGTTGNPKGVEITYKNMFSQVMAVSKCLDFKEGDSMLSFLPMNHLYEISVGFMSFLNKGASIYYIHSLKPKDILAAMKAKKVSFMATVPSFLKLLKSTIDHEIKQYGPFKSKFFKLKYNIAYALNNPIVSKLLFRELRMKFGPNFKGFMSGGAPLELSVGRFFDTIGIPIYEAYGLSEASPVVSMNRKGQKRLGSIGKPLPGVSVRVDSKTQELQVKGNTVMKGYYNNPELTKTVLTEDGWLKTGDIAKISKQGFIYITGRLKNMIVLSGGKKVFPEEVEAVLTKSDLIQEVIVYSDTKKSGAKQGTEEIIAKIFPGEAAINSHDGEELQKLVKEEVKRLSLELSQYKRPTVVDITFEPLPRTGINKISRKAVTQQS